MPIDLARIVSEIVDGRLQHETGRLGDAARNFDYYCGRFEAYPTRNRRPVSGRNDRRRTRRIMRRIVETLTEGQYKKPPTRTLIGDTAASKWLADCYKANRMAALWAKADQYALVADFAGIQFSGSTDPAKVVDVRLWRADELIVWTDPDDPTRAGAVATIDRYDAGMRLRLWTATNLLTFQRRKAAGPAEDDRAWRLVASEPNAYGVIPFAFVTVGIPVDEFAPPGPGNYLAQLNDNINGQLDDIGDNVRFGIIPTPIARNVHPGQPTPQGLLPGEWLMLWRNAVSPADPRPTEPTLEFAVPPSEYVAVAHDDLARYTDGGLEDCGIPPGLIRMTGDAASGFAMLLESAPIVKRNELRRQDFAFFESEAARVCVAVAAAHLGNNRRSVPAWMPRVVADPAPLALKWPPLYVQMPGPERDRSDSWRVDAGLADAVDLLMERDDLTEEEALAKLEALAKRRPRLVALGVPSAVAPTPTKAPAPAVGESAAEVAPLTSE